MHKLLAGLLLIPGVLLLILLASAIFSLPVLWLWNGLMPSIFHLPTITWMQAWGLSILSSLLFKSSASTSSK